MSKKVLSILKSYLEAEKELPIGMRNEAELVMEQGGLLATAEAFLQGDRRKLRYLFKVCKNFTKRYGKRRE